MKTLGSDRFAHCRLPPDVRSIHPSHASGGVPLPSSPYCPCTLLIRIRWANSISLISTSISSHTPTLTALIRASLRRDTSNSETGQKRFIAIGQAKAAGENKFLSVGAELDNVRQRVDGLATFTLTPRVVEERLGPPKSETAIRVSP